MNRLYIECPFCKEEHFIEIDKVRYEHEQICCSCGEKFLVVISNGQIFTIKMIDEE